MSQAPSRYPSLITRLGRSFSGLGELTLLFGAALAGSFRRPFYWQEFVGQCRTVLLANFVPILLTGSGLGFFVSIEAGQFFKAFSSLYRLGGFEVMSNIRELSPVATGLMIAGVSGTAIVADLGARQVRSELDALSVMGMSNVLFIVVPRALALMVMTALYNLPMIVFMMVSGFLAGHLLLGVNTGGYMSSFWTQGTVVGRGLVLREHLHLRVHLHAGRTGPLPHPADVAVRRWHRRHLPAKPAPRKRAPGEA